MSVPAVVTRLSSSRCACGDNLPGGITLPANCTCNAVPMLYGAKISSVSSNAPLLRS